jgi:hypothetical protein
MAAGGQGAAGPFDGVWNTTMSCEAKGSAQGYTWRFTSTVANNILHGERGEAGQPGYLALDGRINRDGSAKLTASGVVASTEYAHGPFTKTGAQYSYEVKSHFTLRRARAIAARDWASTAARATTCLASRRRLPLQNRRVLKDNDAVRTGTTGAHQCRLFLQKGPERLQLVMAD